MLSLKLYTIAMSAPSPTARKSRSLAREIALVLIAKAILLFTIWALWFDHPVPEEQRAQLVSRTLLNK
jgi:hypothetical protein